MHFGTISQIYLQFYLKSSTLTNINPSKARVVQHIYYTGECISPVVKDITHSVRTNQSRDQKLFPHQYAWFSCW